MTTVLYARVSTVEQTLEHQIAQARSAGFDIADDDVIADHGVSGVSTSLRDRPNGRRLFDRLRKGDVLVVRWIDRLGRNYEDVTAAIREFLKRGVTVRTLITNMVFDGAPADPMAKAVRDALIGFMAAMGEAQAEATKVAQAAGIAHAKSTKDKAYLGRKPSFTRAQLDTVRDMLDSGAGISEVAKASSLSRQTVYRIKDDMAGAEAALATWGG